MQHCTKTQSKRREEMKKVLTAAMIVLFLTAAIAYAGGDQNRNRHDGAKGQGPTIQTRTNK